jgi:hypothetical protein
MRRYVSAAAAWFAGLFAGGAAASFERAVALRVQPGVVGGAEEGADGGVAVAGRVLGGTQEHGAREGERGAAASHLAQRPLRLLLRRGRTPRAAAR